jgi:hypothetical protein
VASEDAVKDHGHVVRVVGIVMVDAAVSFEPLAPAGEVETE